jgi:hypothetical protein
LAIASPKPDEQPVMRTVFMKHSCERECPRLDGRNDTSYNTKYKMHCQEYR